MTSTDNFKVWNFKEAKFDEEGQINGDFSKFLRGMTVNRPTLLESDEVAPVADIFVRELIQNSWDSADDQRKFLKKEVDTSEIVPFSIDFIFESLKGVEKKQLIDGGKLNELVTQLKAIDTESLDQNGERFFNGVQNSLAGVSNGQTPLQTLKIVESGTGGMHGQWGTSKSRLFAAMLSVGNNQGSDSAGGSFGYGKAGLIQASGPSIVFAYTAVDPRRLTDDDETSRMLLGVAYWDQYKSEEGIDFAGWATIGLDKSGATNEVASNEVADQLAQSLGIEVRDPKNPKEIGTTFLILSPNINAESVKNAAEIWWWEPLINSKKQFSINISDEKGLHLNPDPETNEGLSAFLKAYKNVNEDDPQILTKSLGKFLKTSKDNHLGTSIEMGELHLIVDTEPGGWSFPEKELEGEASLIALMRKPGMVVEYDERSTGKPYVRGCFISSAGVANDLLRQTEPQLHQKWERRPSPDIDKSATGFAKFLHTKFGRELSTFRSQFIQRRVTTTRIRHKLFDQLCGGNPDEDRARTRKKKPVTPREVREISIQTIHTSPKVVSETDRTISGIGKFHFEPMPKVMELAPFEIEITLGYFFIDDKGLYDRKDPVPVNIDKVPYGFTKTQRDGKAVLRGILSSEGMDIAIKTDPHSANFTGKFIPTAEMLFEEERKGQ